MTHQPMRHKTTSILLAAFFGALTAHAQLSIPSDGSDGAFAPVANVEIDLGLATTALWTAPGSGNGVYDTEKWAVVFKYSSVNIPAGVTVTFKNHPSYAPVVWLVQGNVTIAGELNLDGKLAGASSVARLTPAEPGPGGFRGGASGPLGYGQGLGPGTGPGWSSFGRYAERYGNPQIIPLVGGSGGSSGSHGFFGESFGNGAGGAILIASSGTIHCSGKISTDSLHAPATTPGSGGAIRLVASQIAGNGTLSAISKAVNGLGSSVGNSANGRIRLETNSLSTALLTYPESVAIPPANPPVIWPAANAPTARVISVDSINAPLDPRAPLVAAADVAIQNSNQVNILIETTNFPIEGAVQLNITPKFGDRTTLTATRLSGDITSAIWRVQTTLPQGFVTLQARATQP